MAFAIHQGGAWRELRPTFPVTVNDISVSWDSVSSWSDDERKAFGIYTIAEPEAPAGQVEVSRVLGGDDAPAWIVTYINPPAPAAPIAPDNPSLRLWRTGLKLWVMPDGSTRFASVEAAISALEGSTDPQAKVLGLIAREAWEYANTVDRVTLTGMMSAFGFSADEVEESLWRADRAGQGDFSGVWPLPAAA